MQAIGGTSSYRADRSVDRCGGNRLRDVFDVARRQRAAEPRTGVATLQPSLTPPSTIESDSILPSAATRTAHAVATIAKSPCRSANSSNAYPQPLLRAGTETPVTSSSAASVVVKNESKNASAAILRDPPADCASICASSATATSGISALGSACASEPQIVPRLRVWRCPTCGSASAKSGIACGMRGSRSASAWRTSAPM